MFHPKDPAQARDRAKRVRDVCEAIGHPRTLTACQAAVARAWGARDWTVATKTGGPYVPDERCSSVAEVAERIGDQVVAFSQSLDLPFESACAVAYASRPTSAVVPNRATAVGMAFRFERKPARIVVPQGPSRPGTVRVWAISWEESEKGWGERPDGCSVHATPEAAFAFVKDYWAGQPDEIPEEYSRPNSDVVAADLEEGDSILVDLGDDENRLGARYWNFQPENGRITAAARAFRVAPDDVAPRKTKNGEDVRVNEEARGDALRLPPSPWG